MLEMLETATILRHATRRSFVIMDEVGRGTTSLDGIAIAFACLHHLYYKNQCRTLFATHFHEVADMISPWPKAGNLCTDVAEEEVIHISSLNSGWRIPFLACCQGGHQ
jgi:DNA mismatch repair ATPase MutS